ncbi:MAG: glycosyltransferase family 4 protein [Mariprofundaceae bacterium]|nr:glycosyltransferase family 4 protein [Mariprofundaceae bacterium]
MVSLRVLVVADVSAEAVHGGAERMLFHHLRALRDVGMAVTVLTRQPDVEAGLLLALDCGVMEHRLPFSGDKGYAGLRQLKNEAKKWWRAHQYDFDVVVAEQPFVMWALLQAGCALPRLQVVHSFAFEEFETRYGLHISLKHQLVIAAMRRLEQKVYGSANKLLVLSQFMQDRLFNFFSVTMDKSAVVAGAAEPLTGLSLNQREQYRQALAWHTPTIVTLRNLVPRTGVDLLIQVAAIIHNQGLEMRFVIMGDGALKTSMQLMAKALGVADCVEFTGFLPEEEVKKRLLAADIFMVPTRGLEGFGLVTLEANACGTPVLATPIAANKELVPNIVFNQLAACASPLALAEKVISMGQTQLSTADRQAIVEDAAKQYTWDKHDAGFLQMIRGLT